MANGRAAWAGRRRRAGRGGAREKWRAGGSGRGAARGKSGSWRVGRRLVRGRGEHVVKHLDLVKNVNCQRFSVVTLLLRGDSAGERGRIRSALRVRGLPSSVPVVPKHKDRSGAPPVRSLYDEYFRPGLGSTPLGSRIPASFSITQSALVGSMPSTPGTASSMFSPASVGEPRKTTLSPAQPDPFYTRGDSQRSEDQCDATWVTVFGFPQASASYILLQFAQYGNILKHVMSNKGNWMHICYQCKLQAWKALSKDGRIFGNCIRIGVKPCVDKAVMENFERSSASSVSSVFTPPTKSVASTLEQPANYTTRFPTMRPLVPPYEAFASDYQVFLDRGSRRKGESIAS